MSGMEMYSDADFKLDFDRIVSDLEIGWQKGTYGDFSDPRACVCLLGACNRQAYEANPKLSEFRWEGKVDGVFIPVILDLFPDRFTEDGEFYLDVPAFNDHEDTTLDDVIAVVREAQKREAVA